MHKTLIWLVAFLSLSACNNEQASEKPAAIANATIEQPTLAKPSTVAADGTYCFKKVENQDVTNLQITIASDNITGFMNWIPYQKDSARGTLTGTKDTDGELDLLYDYMIEGNQQTETILMKIENEKLWIKKGELTDPKNDGHLVYKDVTQAKYTDSYDKADCKSLTE